MKNTLGIIAVAVLSLILLSGCAQSIGDVKNETYIGQEVTVKGTVTNTLKIGDLSGYTIIGDDGEEITVSSQSLPAEGEEVRVTGTLEQRPLIGYVIVQE